MDKGQIRSDVVNTVNQLARRFTCIDSLQVNIVVLPTVSQLLRPLATFRRQEVVGRRPRSIREHLHSKDISCATSEGDTSQTVKNQEVTMRSTLALEHH